MLRSFFIAGAVCLGAQPAMAEPWSLDGSAALVSDYRWRGVSLSDQDPSLQVEAALSHESGFWLWGGANSVSSAYGGTELGVGAGWSAPLAGIDWSLGATQYVYPGEDDIDYAEIHLEADRDLGPWSLASGITYAPPQRNYSDDVYLWASAERSLSARTAAHIGAGFDRGSMASGPNPSIDYGAGLRVAFAKASIDVSYVAAVDVDRAVVARLGYEL